MMLFHFTAEHAIKSIRANGLTKGRLPWNLDSQGNPTFRRPFQWLTTNSSFDQPWCLLGNLPFARNAYRITIAVPKEHQGRVRSWLELCRRCQPDSAEELNRTGGDVENWRVYHGPIPPWWFVEVMRNHGQHLTGESEILGHG